MEKKFKKITSVVSSILMVGSTIGFAMAAGGAPFVQNSNPDYAIVYGTGAAVSDVTASNTLNTYLNTFYSVETNTDITDTDSSSSSTFTSDFSSSVSLTDEIELGQDNIVEGSKLRDTIEDNKLSTLLDKKIRWDDGDGSESYDVHEEILLTNEDGNNKLELVTNLNHPDGEDLDSFVVLQNDESLRYRLVFDDELQTPSDWDDAEGLSVNILGKGYEIIEFDSEFDDVTISLSEEEVVREGSILNVEGVTLTIGTIFDDEIQVNGVIINEDSTKRVNGIEVEVQNVALHTDSTLSKAVIRVGKDIERDISNGDEYTKNEETWEWDIGINDEDKQYIGVKYALRSIAYDEDEPEENPIFTGQSYIFPENYAALSFDGLTDVTYKDYDLSFDDKDLYAGDSSTKQNDIDVAIFEGEDDDSFTLIYDGSEIETDSLYFENVPQVGTPESANYTAAVPQIGWLTSLNYTAAVPQIGWLTSTDYAPAHVKMYFKDIDGDVDDDKKGRIQDSLIDINLTENVVFDLATLIVKDTELNVGLLNESSKIYLTLTNDLEEVTKMQLGVDGDSFKRLGERVDNADAGDIIVDGENIGTIDYDVMDNYGTIIKDPEKYGDDDKVILSVPSEQVYATVSVKGQGEEVVTTTNVNATETNTTITTPTPQLGGILIKDTEIASVKDKNLILIGGSCINAETAKLLGGKTCGSEFTLQTGVINGQALIKSFASPYNESKIAVVIAGYSAADTMKGVNHFVNNDVDLTIGQKVIV